MFNKNQNDNAELIENFGNRGEKLLLQNLSENEETLIKLKGSHGEGLVITDKHLYVLKWGFMAGSTFGGRCVAFEYTNISGIDIKKGLITGTVEILTPSTQNTQKGYWGSRGNDAVSSDNMVTFLREKFNKFQEAVKVGRDIIANRRNPISTNNNDSITQLERLASLKEKGIISEKEFDKKKKQLLDL